MPLSTNDYRDLAECAKASLHESAARPPQERNEPTQLTESMGKMFEGPWKPEDFSLRNLWIHAVPDGRSALQLLESRGSAVLHEAAVNTSMFANITNQLISQKMMEPLAPAEMPFSALIPTQPTRLRGEKIAGVSDLGDVGQVVAEQERFPTAGVNEDWIETPVTTKRGIIVQVTKEAILTDNTGLVLMRAKKVGEALAIAKEKRAIDCIIDENRTIHRHKWRGTSYATYQSSSPWDNVTASNALVDWTDVDNANQTFNAMVDPNTGEPIVVKPTHLICTQSLEEVAWRIKNATGIVLHVGGYATSGNLSDTHAPARRYDWIPLTSALLASRLATDTTWFFGNPGMAFLYMENWPLTVVEAPTNSHEEFHYDIVSQFKASEMGEFTTVEPRAMQTCTA